MLNENGCVCSCGAQRLRVEPTGWVGSKARLIALAFFILASTGGWAVEPDQFQQQSAYDGMEIEDLMGLSISSLSKHQEPVSKAAAAVFVLTSEDIRKAPVTTLVEVLRLIPGINVQRINNTTFNVSIRGLNGPFPKHLLVMVDGRSIYNPLYAGVYWEQRDLPLSTIDRIEVVRGPGGAVWGSNALNGVINIITKPSGLQQGGELLAQASGRESQATVVVGGGVNDGLKKSATWRLFADDHQYRQSDDVTDDSGVNRRLGIRFDQPLAQGMQWWADAQYYQTNTYHQENIFDGYEPTSKNVSTDIEGYSVNAQLSRSLSADRQWSVQFFAEFYERDIESYLRERQGEFDISTQYRFFAGDHHVTLGANYRGYTDDYSGSESIRLQPESEYNSMLSGFLQDQLQLTEQWALTLGAKYELHRVQAGFFQPTVRLSWSASDDLTMWLAYSRAMQAQTRDYRSIYWRLGCMCYTPLKQVLDGLRPDQRNALPAIVTAVAENNSTLVIPIVSALEGEQENEFETQLAAWEWGARSRFATGWLVDLSIYMHEYTDIVTTATAEFRLHGDAGIDYIERILHYSEGADARTEGADLVLTWRWDRDISWRFAYSYFNAEVSAKSGDSLYYEYQEAVDPLHQASVQHDWQVNERWHLNTFVRYVDKAPYFLRWEAIDAYVTMDVKASYQLLPELEVFVIGKNLFNPEHLEGRVVSDQPDAETEVEESITLGFSIEF